MSTSGTTTQVFVLEDILNGALEVCGIIDPGGTAPPEDRATALKQLQLVAAEFHSKFGAKVWQQERTSNLYTTMGGTAATVVTSAKADYYLGTDTEDVMPGTVFVRRDDNDTMLRELSQKDFARLPDKADRTGLAEAYLIERNQTYTSGSKEWRGRLRLTIYPIPSNSTDAIHYTRLRRTEDWGSANTNPDVPWKYTEAYLLAVARKLTLRYNVSGRRRKEIVSEAIAAEAIMKADDHERGPTRFGVDVSGYYQI